MKVIKEYVLMLNSENRNSGTPYEFTIDIPHEIDISVDKQHNQLIKLSLLKFSSYLEFYNIAQGKTDTIIFKKRNIDSGVVLDTLVQVIPEGNYRYATLAGLLSNDLCTVTYVARLNKFMFDFGAYGGSIQCVNQSDRAFGFNDTEEKQTLGGSVLYSDKPIKPRSFDRLNISLSDVVVLDENYENSNIRVDGQGLPLPGKYLGKSKILASIELNNPPFTLLTYDGSTDGYGIFVDDKRLKRLSFKMTNEHGEPLVEIKDSFIIMRLELMELLIEDTKKHNELVNEIKTTNEYMRLNFLSRNLK